MARVHQVVKKAYRKRSADLTHVYCSSPYSENAGKQQLMDLFILIESELKEAKNHLPF